MNQYSTPKDLPLPRNIIPDNKPDPRLSAIEAELRMLRNEVITLKRKLVRAQQDIATLSARLSKR
jgi:hypothetical protein